LLWGAPMRTGLVPAEAVTGPGRSLPTLKCARGTPPVAGAGGLQAVLPLLPLLPVLGISAHQVHWGHQPCFREGRTPCLGETPGPWLGLNNEGPCGSHHCAPLACQALSPISVTAPCPALWQNGYQQWQLQHQRVQCGCTRGLPEPLLPHCHHPPRPPQRPVALGTGQQEQHPHWG